MTPRPLQVPPLFSFLTTVANRVVGPVHAKAMPDLLTKHEDFEALLTESTKEALKLQRPLPDDAMPVATKGARSDGDEERLLF
jgi:putative SOS response-associated peptidase YedK